MKKTDKLKKKKNRLRRVSNAWRNQAGVVDKIEILIVPICTQDQKTM
jgi:hypothetical protein